MTRRGLIAPALASLAAACSPLALLDRFGPRDPGARRMARDLAYGDHSRQRMNVYAPPGEGPFPTLVFFYGGGWNSGSRDLYGWAAQALAARGFVVFLPDYRLVPEVVFPVFVEDAAKATARAADLAPTYGGDAARLAVLGHSAGAYLALMIALDARYMKAAGRPDVIRAAAGLAGPYDFLPFDVASTRDAFGAAPDPAQTQPVTFARADAPPLWLGHGADDTVVHDEDTLILNDRIKAAGGRSTARIYPGLNHADLIATFSPLFRKKAPVLDDLVAFLHRALG
ncbi:MAG: alpha/beta hydrolase [Brevundimonas sp.]|uniref:alpha/beta hydrolase n=1 Tax=Brevundimonas sp. TaxID=1871086 RepID=UPI002589F33D|nr:alpha/beta hydrolase [Brevundimonas sp.]MCV0415463.1 alpha/beta hydrolase [Brevundimonas sp.]